MQLDVLPPQYRPQYRRRRGGSAGEIARFCPQRGPRKRDREQGIDLFLLRKDTAA
jgi:hypothetical protein